MSTCLICSCLFDKKSKDEERNTAFGQLTLREVITFTLKDELRERNFLPGISNNFPIIVCSSCKVLIQELGKCLVQTKELKKKLINIIKNRETIFEQSQHIKPEEYINKADQYKSSNEHEIVPEIRCNLCTNTFKSTNNFVLHMKKHEDPNKCLNEDESSLIQRCRLCKRKFKTARQHAKHQLTVHGNIIPVTCCLCVPNITLESEKELVRHNKKFHSQRVECKFCKKVYFTNSNLKRHMNRIHNAGTDTILICEICTKMFKSNYHLQQHIKTHTNEKPYMCNLCSKSFKWDSSLNCHIQAAHNPSGPIFKCDICEKSFSDKNNLKNHRFLHSDVKPYSCKQCKKGEYSQ